MTWRDRVQRTLYQLIDAQCGAVADVAWSPPAVPIEQTQRDAIVRLRWAAEVFDGSTAASGGGAAVEPYATVTLALTGAAGSYLRVRAGGALGSSPSARVTATGAAAADAAALGLECAAWLDVTATVNLDDTLTLTGLRPESLLELELSPGVALVSSTRHAPHVIAAARYQSTVSVDAWSRSQQLDARDLLGDAEAAITAPTARETLWLRGVALINAGQQRADLSQYLLGGAWETRASSAVTLSHTEIRLTPINLITSASVSLASEG